ncbi:hypothetical protein AB1Y20_005913 [Prymnesium parvum]|uniref:Uncharacterized protein n=1 Tax=Prymnesium parvum TaxID=97485 RepID=A0AB34J2D4_PRYPA
MPPSPPPDSPSSPATEGAPAVPLLPPPPSAVLTRAATRAARSRMVADALPPEQRGHAKVPCYGARTFANTKTSIAIQQRYSLDRLVRRSSGGEAVVPDFAADYDAAEAATSRALPTDFHAPVPALVDPTIDPAHWDPLRAGGLPPDCAGGEDTADPETAGRDAHIRHPDTWRGRTRHGSNYDPAALLFASDARLDAPFVIYLGSGRPRAGDFASCVARYDIGAVRELAAAKMVEAYAP